jgi:hypothetical protein
MHADVHQVCVFSLIFVKHFYFNVDIMEFQQFKYFPFNGIYKQNYGTM